MFKNILVPTDGSELAVKAVEQSVLFAKEVGANNAAVLLRISVSFTPVTRPFGRQTHLLFSATTGPQPSSNWHARAREDSGS